MLIDFECFNQSVTAGSINSLWEVWDLNSDTIIDKIEYQAAQKLMDLNDDGRTTQLEVKAYYSRNKHLLCRNKTFVHSRDLFEDSKEHFFNMFDRDESNDLNKKDIERAMDSGWSMFSHDGDGQISREEWDRQTRRIFAKICHFGNKVGKIKENRDF